jgi:multicomponent Na+:H+ antiporter subunit C
MTVYVLCLLLFGLGVYCVLAKRNVVKIIVGLVICETAVNLFFVLVAYKAGGVPPIFEEAAPVAAAAMVDPLPHALVLTAIVIGLATTALLVALAMRLHEKYGTFDIAEMRELRG